MKIAILSDIHDHAIHLAKALELCGECDAMICCGDLCSPFIINQLGEGFSREIYIVFGNNDADTFRMKGLAEKFPHMHLHAEFVELELGGLNFAVNHYDNIGQALARGQSHDVVCFGHNHRYEDTKHGKTQAINPGEIYGLRTGDATFAFFDTETREVTRVDL